MAMSNQYGISHIDVFGPYSYARQIQSVRLFPYMTVHMHFYVILPPGVNAETVSARASCLDPGCEMNIQVTEEGRFVVIAASGPAIDRAYNTLTTIENDKALSALAILFFFIYYVYLWKVETTKLHFDTFTGAMEGIKNVVHLLIAPA